MAAKDRREAGRIARQNVLAREERAKNAPAKTEPTQQPLKRLSVLGSDVKTGGVSESAGARRMQESRMEQGGGLPVSPPGAKPKPSTNPFTGVTTDPRLIPVGGFSSGTTSTNKNEQLGIKLRETPGVGKIFRGLDVLQEATEPAANVAQQFYTPGIGAAMAAEKGLATLLGKALPKKLNVLSHVGAASTVGAYTGAGQQLAMKPSSTLGEVGVATGYGALLGGGLSGAGQVIKRGFQYAKESAEQLFNTNPIIRTVVQESGERAVRAESGKQVLAGIDEEIQSLNRSNTPDRAQQLTALINNREETIKYIKQFDPEFEAPKARVTAAKQVLNRVPEEAPAAPSVSEPTAPMQETAQPTTRAPREQGIRSNFETQLGSEGLSDGLKTEIAKLNRRYEPITNVDTVAQADNNIRTKGLDQSLSEFLGREAHDPISIAEGYRLMQMLDSRGRYEDAATVSAKTAEALTKSGQTSQAGVIIQRLSPEGRFIQLTRKAIKNGGKVSPEDTKNFKQAANDYAKKSTAGARDNALMDVLNDLKSGKEPTPEDLQVMLNIGEEASKRVAPAAPVLESAIPRRVRNRDKIVDFLNAQEQAALARLAKKRGQLNSVPVDQWADHLWLVTIQLSRGAIKAETYVEDMVKLFGEYVRKDAPKLYQQAKDALTGVKNHASKAKDVNELFEKAFAEADEKSLMRDLAAHVRQTIEDAKAGNDITDAVQTMRDMSSEIGKVLKNKPAKQMTAEQRYLQDVRAMVKKIEKIESAKSPNPQANRELAALVRKVGNDPFEVKAKPEKMDEATDSALQNIADDVTQRTRQANSSKIRERLLAKYIKDHPEITDEVADTLKTYNEDLKKLEGKEARQADFEMQKIMNKYEKSSAMDKLAAVRYFMMLGNTGTQLINVASGLIQAGVEIPLSIIGSIVEQALVKTKLAKQPQTTKAFSGTNPLETIKTYFGGLVHGGKAGYHGISPRGLQNINEIGGIAFQNVPVARQLEGGLGAVMMGADTALYDSVYNAELRKQASLAAKQAKVADKDEFIQKFMNAPTESAKEIADNIAKETTFQRADRAGGKASQWVSKAGKGKHVIRAIVPFIKTPLNIAAAATDYTPAGLIKGVYKLSKAETPAQQRDAIRAISSFIAGSGLIGGGYLLTDLGILTGVNQSGDSDADAISEQAGRGKYRFNRSATMRVLETFAGGGDWAEAKQAGQYQEGDKQFDYNRLQPLATPLAIGTTFKENEKQGAAKAAESAFAEGFQTLLNMSSLQSVQNLTQTQPGQTAGEKALGLPVKIAESYAKSFSPSIGAQIARVQDPTQRQTAYNKGFLKDIGEYYQSRNPFGFGLGVPTSEQLPARVTSLGDEKQQPQGIGENFFNPLRDETTQFNKAAKIIDDLVKKTGQLDIAPSPPAKKLDIGAESVEIPRERWVQLQKDIGSELTQKILSMDSRESDEKKAARIKAWGSAIKAKYQNRLKKELRK